MMESMTGRVCRSRPPTGDYDHRAPSAWDLATIGLSRRPARRHASRRAAFGTELVSNIAAGEKGKWKIVPTATRNAPNPRD